MLRRRPPHGRRAEATLRQARPPSPRARTRPAVPRQRAEAARDASCAGPETNGSTTHALRTNATRPIVIDNRPATVHTLSHSRHCRAGSRQNRGAQGGHPRDRRPLPRDSRERPRPLHRRTLNGGFPSPGCTTRQGLRTLRNGAGEWLPCVHHGGSRRLRQVLCSAKPGEGDDGARGEVGGASSRVRTRRTSSSGAS
jgi:hypothetical protein